MLPIKDAKIMKIGNSYAVVIPKDYITNGLIDPDKRCNIIIEDCNGEETNNNGVGE